MERTLTAYQRNRVCYSLPLFLLCMLAFGVPAIAASEPTGSTPQAAPFANKADAKAIAAQIIGAYGGIDVLKATNAAGYRAHATLRAKVAFSEASNSVDTDVYCQGDKLRMESVSRGQKNIMAYDGKVCWTQSGNWVSASTPQQTKAFTEDLGHGLEELASFEDPAVKLELRDGQSVADKPCDVLLLTLANGKSTTFYADKKTHLIARTEFLGVDHHEGLPAVHATDYDDWRPLDGTLMPFKSAAYTGGKQNGTLVITSYEPAKLPDNIFTMPPESEIAEIKRAPVVLPFEYVGGHIIVNAKINGQLDCKLIVDTGAAVTTLHQAFAQRLGNVATSDLMVGTVTKAVRTNYAVLDSLSLGRATVNDISAVVGDFSMFGGGSGDRPVGLLGADVLKRFLVTINFQDKTLTLSDPKEVTVPPKLLSFRHHRSLATASS